MNINSNLSSINAHQSLLNSSAHNIANSNTKEFERVNTNIIGQNNDSVKAVDTKIPNDNIYSNTDMTKEVNNQILSYHAVGANTVAIKTQNETADTIIDILA
ncbi:MAG: hypothetical protein U9Q04_03455 [Campylobacterota bacterium]|nr:hypothetical protein [Campylobacterota bacterium]